MKLSWRFLVVLSLITLSSCQKDNHYAYFRKNVNDIHFAIAHYNRDFKNFPINNSNESGLDTKTELFEKLSGKNLLKNTYSIDERFFDEVEIAGAGEWLIITYPGEDGKYNTIDDLIGMINLKIPENPSIFKVNELVEFD